MICAPFTVHTAIFMRYGTAMLTELNNVKEGLRVLSLCDTYGPRRPIEWTHPTTHNLFLFSIFLPGPLSYQTPPTGFSNDFLALVSTAG